MSIFGRFFVILFLLLGIFDNWPFAFGSLMPIWIAGVERTEEPIEIEAASTVVKRASERGDDTASNSLPPRKADSEPSSAPVFDPLPQSLRSMLEPSPRSASRSSLTPSPAGTTLR